MGVKVAHTAAPVSTPAHVSTSWGARVALATYQLTLGQSASQSQMSVV